MSTWLIVLLSLAAALVTGVLAGFIIFILWRRADRRADRIQRALNRVENRFAQAGVTGWLADVLESLVVGDENAIATHVGQLTQADDSTLFFLEQVAIPCALYAIRQTRVDYPEKFTVIERELLGAKNDPNKAT